MLASSITAHLSPAISFLSLPANGTTKYAAATTNASTIAAASTAQHFPNHNTERVHLNGTTIIAAAG